MSATPAPNPGTVSKILWHFTGGPSWIEAQRRQDGRPKPAANAYDNLLSILRTRELRLGSYKEVFRVTIPERRIRSKKTGEIEVQKDVPIETESAPVCCLSDIPAANLGYHSSRYGKFAIGYHRNSAVKNGFNPVFYSLQDTGVVRAIYKGFSELESIDPWTIQSAASDIQSAVVDADEDIASEVDSLASDIDWEADDIESALRSTRESLSDFLAFVKTFDESEFGTIYCEREWRCLSAFAFEPSDIAMIVLPREVNRRKYFLDFVDEQVPNLKLPRSIPVVPWEDLVEH